MSTGTPSATALSYLLPAASPQMTKLVFFDTLPETFAPLAFRRAPASSRVMPDSTRLPVSTKVRPASVCGTSSAGASSARFTPRCARRRSTSWLAGVRKNECTLAATMPPTPSTSVSSSTLAAESASMVGNAATICSAVVLPTWRMPRPNSTRANERPLLASMAATSFAAMVEPRCTGVPSFFERPVSRVASSYSSSV